MEYLSDIAHRVQEELRAGGYKIPHRKLPGWEPEVFCRYLF